MTAFNRQETKQVAIDIKIRRAKLQCKNATPDMKLKHQSWVTDANRGIYTILVREVTNQVKKKQERNAKFVRILHETTE